MSFEIGSTVAGKYRIEHVLGQGGMGTVYKATHLLLDRPVALKVLHSGRLELPNATERLLREGRSLARLRGRHVARLLDVEKLESGFCYLVLEYLEGEDLRVVLKRSGHLSHEIAGSYVLQACEALAEAHAQGIIHRDIKPSNLFLALMQDGAREIKVIDFGIAKRIVDLSDLTHSHSLVGSPQYMSPEQLRSDRDVDARCDIWSLGVALYELLTGRLPYTGANVLAICASILESTPRRPSEFNPDIPHGIDAIVGKCLARDPAERFVSVHELGGAIAECMTPSSARIASPSAVTSPGEPLAEPLGVVRNCDDKTTTDDAIAPRRRKRTSSALWIIALFLIALIASVGGHMRKSNMASSPSSGSVSGVAANETRAAAAVSPKLDEHVAHTQAAPVGPVEFETKAVTASGTKRASGRSGGRSRRTTTGSDAPFSPELPTPSGDNRRNPALEYGRY